MNSEVNYPYRIPACWEACDAVVLVWPRQDCDDELLEFYEALASVLPDYANLSILVAADQDVSVREHLKSLSVSTEYIFFHPVNATDINIAKWGSAIVQTEKGFAVLPSDKTHPELLQALPRLFPCADIQTIDFLLHQGTIESDGADQLILNKSLWLEQNPEVDISEAIQFLKKSCGIKDLITLAQPDTIQHMPVRLAPDNCIFITACDDPDSPHFSAFTQMQQALEQELQTLATDYQLRSLPWVGNLTDEQGQEYFADYSQYLVINGAILIPMFNLPVDEDAMEIISQQFPGFDILGFPSAALAKSANGLTSISLTMPEGVLEPL
jgi:agmatine deiminase